MKWYSITAGIIILLFSACSTQQDEARLKMLNESMIRNNTLIAKETTLYYESIKARTHEPYQAKSKRWLPKVKAIHEATENMLAYINSLKKALSKQSVGKLFHESDEAVKLSGRLANYKKEILDILKPEDLYDTDHQREYLKKQIGEFDRSLPLDSSTLQPALCAASFKDASSLMAQVILNKIENDILVSEQILADYCHKESYSVSMCNFEQPMAIAVQNSTYLKGGQTLEITAGVGMFSTRGIPKINIGRDTVPVQNDGAAEYKFRVPNKPGKYTIPVRIEYMRADSSIYVVTKILHYTVAP